MGSDIVKDILKDHDDAFECIYTEFFKRLPSATREWPSIYKEQEALSRMIKVLNKVKKDGNDSLFEQLSQPGSSFSIFQDLSTDEILERLEYMKAVRVNPMHSKSIWPKNDPKNIPRKLLMYGMNEYLTPLFKKMKESVKACEKYGEINISQENKREVIKRFLESKDIEASTEDNIRVILNNFELVIADDNQLKSLLKLAYDSSMESFKLNT